MAPYPGTSTLASPWTLSSTNITNTATTWPVWNYAYTTTWPVWNYAYTTTWPVWNYAYTTTNMTGSVTYTNIAQPITWGNWNIQKQSINEMRQQVRGYVPARKKSDAEVQAELRERIRMEQVRREQEAAQVLRMKTMKEADARADELLLSTLSEQQRRDLGEKGCFYLHVGERRYRIDRGSHGNVKLLDKEGRIVKSFCVQPAGVPRGDCMLAQKLWLEANDNALEKMANVTLADGRIVHATAA